MTALWIALALLALITVCNTLAVGALWIYCAAMTTVLNKHIRDDDRHWARKWDDVGGSETTDA